ncbi:MAG: XRE family transcriptional regulator [Candidatus Brocadiia bacterium]|nr:MAG: XRE family transcriptional regulator [Candidatus Brocadiia bacterium]
MNSTYDFGIIRVLRQKLNLTLKNLAQQAGLTYTTVETIETNKTIPSLKTLDAVAGALQISTTELLTLAERKLVQKRTAKVVTQSNPAKNSMGLITARWHFMTRRKSSE